MTAPDQPKAAPLGRWDVACILVLVAWGIAWLAPGLDHPRIMNWDESFHQAATRGVYERGYPHVLVDPLYPLNLRHWWYSGVWLHKPPGAFWFGGLMMHLIGVRPMALRLGSLVGELGSAVLIFLIARPLVGRSWSLVSAACFLVLPFGWVMVQGQFVGDVTDLTLTGWMTLSIAWLIWSIEKESWRWAAAAGAAMGVAYLCKSFLSLTPLGVVGTMWLLGRFRLCRGPRGKDVAAFVVAALLVALPWNIYAARTWPDPYWRAVEHTLGFISPESGEDVGPGARPRDAIFNEINEGVYSLPPVVCLVAAVWLAIRAARRREYTTVTVALWLWATWIAHSFVNVKGHSHLWNAVPAFFVGLALLLPDAWKYPALAGALVGGFFARDVSLAVPFLNDLHRHVPAWFVQTHRAPGLVDGIVVAAAGAALAVLAGRAVRRWPGWALVPRLLIAAVATGCWVWFLGVGAPRKLLQNVAENDEDQQISYTKELGLALDQVLPERSVLFMDKDIDHPHTFEWLNLIFWSGRMVEQKSPDVGLATSRGYHPYLVSPSAEPFQPVEPVPPNAWMRAYDLLAPAEPPGLPPGVLPAAIQVGNQRVIGVASGPVNRTHDRYAIYVQADGMPTELRMAFVTDSGREERVLGPELTLRIRQKLEGKAWFILPVVGPRRERVKAVDFGTGSLPLG